jgi:hypothetical protein
MKTATPLDSKGFASSEVRCGLAVTALKLKFATLAVYLCYVAFLIRFSLPPALRRDIFPWLVFLVAPLPALLIGWLPRRSSKR